MKTRLPPELDRPEVLAYIAQLLAWRDGDPVPPRPTQLTLSDEQLAAHLNDAGTRRALVERLSVLVPHPDRRLRRRRR